MSVRSTTPSRLAGLLLASADRNPDAPALLLDNERLTYGELARDAGRVGEGLKALGVRPGDRVALLARKGAETTASLYGILWAGAAYVPLDPAAPPARHALILKDAGASVAIGEPVLLEALQRAGAGHDGRGPITGAILLGPVDPQVDATIPFVKGVTFGALGLAAPLAPVEGSDTDLAYLLYTSGSTGQPKGVMHTHRSALAFALWAAEECGLVADDRIANHAPFHFDLSTFDYFSTARAGACVMPIPSREAAFPASVASRTEKDRHSIVYATPSTWVQMMGHGRLAERDLSSLRVALYAGEVFPPASLARFLALLPRGARCLNLYGPTETNVCTYAEVDRAPLEGEPSNIGRACPYVEVRAVDERGAAVDTGETGELWVKGGSVMSGYWADPERTARVLQPDPSGELVYHTGDMVRPLADGTFQFLGRRDHQVKIRGYRVELGEIETVLAGHAAVSEAVVIAIPHPEHGSALRASVVAAAGIEADPRELKRHCAARLPAYMVPERIELRTSLPRTASGKIDRRALAEEEARTGA